MNEKSHVVMDIKRFGITTRWVMEIETLNCPYIVTDRMISGPFSFFRHQRDFLPLDNAQTLMHETISLSLPLGWIGNLLFPFIKKDMDQMFEYRHRQTQKYFLQSHS